MFDTDVMPTVHSPAELESLRRSAAMAPLPPRQVLELLDGYLTLANERTRIEAMFAELGPSWRNARTVLNDLSDLLAGTPLPSAAST